ncbi:MAG: hypothetical protein ACE5JQ_01040 [Candidatus Methylomirabilales bacterium]
MGAKVWLSFVASVVLGTLYAGLVGVVSARLRWPFVAWPVFILAFWLVLWRWGWLRFVGFFAILPVSILGFEVLQSNIRPSFDVHHYLTIDRSHYLSGTRIRKPESLRSSPGHAGWGVKEMLIGADGFRADPVTGVGNPDRCRWALIGDSVIFGSGLPYRETIGPVLRASGLDVCVFGVSGNGMANYLATFRYVQDRLEPSAHVAIYLFTENDFVWTTNAISSAPWWQALSDLVNYFEYWRQATYTYRFANGGLTPVSEPNRIWDLQIGEGESVKLLRDPAGYVPPTRLTTRQQRYLEFFFKGLLDLVRAQPWQVSVVLLPAGMEILANLASRNSQLRALDLARLEALEMCRTSELGCEDFAPYLYTRTVAEGKNPYFTDDLHYSAFGTRVLAEHYLAISGHLLAGQR